MSDETFGSRVRNAWNAFFNKDPTMFRTDLGMSDSRRPDRIFLTRGSSRSIVTTIYNRIAIDVAATTIEHVRLDENDRYIETINDDINKCINLSANMDQTGRAFIQDVVMSMFDEGCVAMVPIDTETDPNDFESIKIKTIRVGKIVEWYPAHVRIRAYNERTGKHEEIVMSKKAVGIVENPLYAIMNEPNSTLQRLIHKLALLDRVDEQTSSGKLDLIIQLPYVVKNKLRRDQAEQRRREMEEQLAGSKYGVAYSDGTEKIVQLNRSLDNNLLKQIDALTQTLYNQLGLTPAVFDGTANEEQMNNYLNRTIEPILAAICDEMNRKFLTATARTQRQTFKYFRDPFRLVPTSQLSELADKFTRNEIMSSNEWRQVIGLKPVDDPRANELRNKNLNAGEGEEFADTKQIENPKL